MPVLARLRYLPRAIALIMLCVSMISFSAQAGNARPTEASASSPQGLFIQHLGDEAIEILKKKDLTKEQRNKTFRNLLDGKFDLKTIARFVIGRNWRSATPAQQIEYLDLFKKLVVKTYSDRFSLYAGEGFKVRSVSPEGRRDFIVKSDITHPDGSKPTVITWRVRQKDSQMGIIDVVVEGISMSVTQRQEYSSVIQRNGGNIESLLSMMRQRINGNRGTQS
ncbi:MAG TPA: toluene tolerance protein [Rhodospirillaceae bacterium]|nr:toluene tolerance protein [Rhodospirillaceae bacterium]